MEGRSPTLKPDCVWFVLDIRHSAALVDKIQNKLQGPSITMGEPLRVVQDETWVLGRSDLIFDVGYDSCATMLHDLECVVQYTATNAAIL